MTNQTEPLTLTAETLSGIGVFKNLDTDDRKMLVPHCKYSRYLAGQAIVTYHDQSRDVFFIVTGNAQATIYSLAGKQVTLQNLGPGQMFGELSAIDGEPRSAHVLAATDTNVVSMGYDDFKRALLSYPAIAEITLKRLAQMVRLLSERVFEISALPVKQRVRAELLRRALNNHNTTDNSAVISPIPNHTDIANHIGTHREAVSREFAKLIADGLIKREQQALIFCDVNRLAQLVHHNPDA